jgi:pimeloyl-ACP methyl ester carboxylesterase
MAVGQGVPDQFAILGLGGFAHRSPAGFPAVTVQAVAHGRSSDRDQPFRFETSADDVSALLGQLNVAQADLFGFSNGASVALQAAIRHPQSVRKLVFASSFTKRAGALPELWTFMEQASFANMPQPLKDAFLKVNPDPAQLRTMHDKDAERMRHFQDVPDADVHAIRAPTLILLGDQDIVRPEHAMELARSIPNARLLILVGGHGDYLGEAVMTQSSARQRQANAAHECTEQARMTSIHRHGPALGESNSLRRSNISSQLGKAPVCCASDARTFCRSVSLVPPR